MAELILVRHAPTAWTGRRYCGRSDPPLEGPGRVAARRLAATLARLLPPGTPIVSSPLRRARETAAAIAEAVGDATILLDDRWRETDFGVGEGRTFDELAMIDPGLAARLAAGDTTVDWPDGETGAAFADRIAEAWQDLVAADVTTVLVSHAGPIRAVLAIGHEVAMRDVAILEPASFARLRLPVPPTR